MKNHIRLGVNVDHVATLRQVRGGTTPYPSVLDMVRKSVKGGAEQITIHLREDRRHIQLHDLVLLSKKCPVDLNLEMAATDDMVRLARKYKPEWVCLVPEKRAELTTEGGLNVAKGFRKMKPMVEKMQMRGIEISMFIEPSLEQVEASYKIGADAVEFHTGHWVLLKGAKKEKEWQRLVNAAHLAHASGLRVHAGHGLDYHHAKLIRKLPYLQEVNIGHSLVCYALEDGLEASVRKMKKVLKGS
ncbi:pyridoxine 5'-phosphate synthase [Bdellovibrio sp. HCB337]|uniref:pyridoxine 5'-phosphate synthase n=1 Tax=Bdellovibrio sp. HCB337 TaxID=3394358 RepID=UPI0039A592E5